MKFNKITFPEKNEKLYELDYTKVTSIREIALMLDSLDIYLNEESKHFEELKHLIK